MKMTRPHFFFSMPGRKWRERRTPLRTFTSKKRSQSESGISRKGLGSKIPRLLTRMSASGTCWRNVSTPWAVPKSAGTPRRSLFSTLVRIFLTAASTRASVRPLTMTLAPSAASAAAMAKPIPAVDPDTTAVLPLIFRSISRFLVDSCGFLPDANSRGYAFDLGDLARGELQFTSAHDAFGLLGVARANNGAGDSGMAQGPGDGDFTGGTPMACALLAQALDEFDIFRQAWLAKFRTAAAKIIGWQRGGALASHGPGEQAGGHRGVHNHADPLLFTVGQSFRFDLPPDQRVRRLKGCYRGNLFGALNLLRIEVRNTDPTNFPFFLERGERLPCFFESGTVVVRRPMDLVKIDRVHLQAAQTVLAFAADRSGAEFLSGVPFFVPAKDALGEHIGARAAPFLQRAGYDFFGMAHAVDGGGIDPIDAKFERTMNRRDGIRILLRGDSSFARTWRQLDRYRRRQRRGPFRRSRSPRAEGMARPAPLCVHQVRPSLGRKREHQKGIQRRFDPPRMPGQPAPPASGHDRSLPDPLAAGRQRSRSRRSMANARRAQERRESSLDRCFELQCEADSPRRKDCPGSIPSASLLADPAADRSGNSALL